MTIETEPTERKRTTKPADERRRDLMDASVRVFREKGIARTTVSDITGAAGVAKGTFYLYFASKEHLLGALKERLVDEILAEAVTLYSRVGREDWWALVDTTIEAVVDFHLSRADVIQIIVQEGLSPDTSEIFRECEERVDAMYAAAIKAGRDAGAFRVTDPELTARLLHYALDGALKHAVLYVEEIDRDRLIAAAQELVRKALAP
jgi:AcrR family transcriptional regulator